MVKKSLVIALALIMMSASFISCAAITLSDKNIRSIELSLYEVSDNGGHKDQASMSIIPGKTYKVKMLVKLVEGDIIDDPDYNDIGLLSPNKSFCKIIRVDSRSVYVEANPESFDFVDGSKFEIKIKVAENKYKKEFTYPVDWDGLNTISLSGKSGKDGEDGKDGRDGTDGGIGESGEPGSNGTNGTAGTNGEDAENMVFDVAYYDVGNNIEGVTRKMVVYYNRETEKLFLTKPQNVTINASGGDGGNGGNGGNGGDGGDGDSIGDADTYGGDGGNGGNGGNAGNGGNGGNITLNHLKDSKVTKKTTVMQNGGKAGQPGTGGRGGEGGEGTSGRGRRGLQGNYGNSAKGGVNGTLSLISHVNFDDMFNNIPHPKFDKSKIH